MFKLILLVFVFILFSYAGYIYGERFNKRHKSLKEILKSIMFLQNEILYNSTPLAEALICVGNRCRDPLKPLLNETANLIYKGEEESVYDMFKDIYPKYKEELCLNRDDYRVITDFLKSLGELGIYGHEKMFELAKANIEMNIKEAKSIAEKNTKLYRYLGICIGAMIVIFFI